MFWATFINGTEKRHFVANTTPNGTNHQYEFRLAGCGCSQDFFYDNVYAGAGTGMTSGKMYDIKAGLELSAPFIDATVSTFAQNMSSTSPGGANLFWTTHNISIDDPCGTYQPGSCLNGVAYAPYEWSSNEG